MTESKQRRLYLYQRAAPSLSLCSAQPWIKLVQFSKYNLPQCHMPQVHTQGRTFSTLRYFFISYLNSTNISGKKSMIKLLHVFFGSNPRTNFTNWLYCTHVYTKFDRPVFTTIFICLLHSPYEFVLLTFVCTLAVVRRYNSLQKYTQ